MIIYYKNNIIRYNMIIDLFIMIIMNIILSVIVWLFIDIFIMIIINIFIKTMARRIERIATIKINY